MQSLWLPREIGDRVRIQWNRSQIQAQINLCAFHIVSLAWPINKTETFDGVHDTYIKWRWSFQLLCYVRMLKALSYG